MNNKIFTPGEILTIQTNMNEIEKNLGHPIPGGFIDASDMKDHILRPGEVSTVCQNIERVTGSPKKRRAPINSTSDLESVIILVLLAVGAICVFFDFVLGVDLLWWTH